MIYPQRDNRRRKNKMLVTAGVIGGFILVIVVLSIWNPNLVSPVVHRIGKPIMQARGGFLGSINSTWQYLHTKGQLTRENQMLRDKAALLEAVQTERDYYKSENVELAQLIGKIQHDKKRTFAKILSKPGFSPYDTMIIDSGEDQQITVGDLVLAVDDTVIGKITNVYSRTSVVGLFSSPEYETPVLVGTSSIQAMAVGKGAGNFEIKVPRNTGIQVDDIVVIASSTAKVFGKVQYIHVSPEDSYERILFKSTVDVSKISTVIIERL